jgi:hypothetical protein
LEAFAFERKSLSREEISDIELPTRAENEAGEEEVWGKFGEVQRGYAVGSTSDSRNEVS